MPDYKDIKELDAELRSKGLGYIEGADSTQPAPRETPSAEAMERAVQFIKAEYGKHELLLDVDERTELSLLMSKYAATLEAKLRELQGRADQFQAQLAAYRAMVDHLADIVEACDQAGGALTVTVVREARELLSTPVPATDRWLAERDAKVRSPLLKALKIARPFVFQYAGDNRQGLSIVDRAIEVAEALESRAGTEKLAPEK